MPLLSSLSPHSSSSAGVWSLCHLFRHGRHEGSQLFLCLQFRTGIDDNNDDDNDTVVRTLPRSLSGYGWRRTGGPCVPGPVASTCSSYSGARPTWPTGDNTVHMMRLTVTLQASIRPPGSADRVEHVPGHVLHHGRRQDAPGVHAHPLHPRLLPLALHPELHRE